ncbi:molybdopterin-dependent oxidoreductase [Leptothrix ochracea]|uniref:molybdopterin-containing oxidoreductase family protein n=1 Tax=Leptothrix ochracea TaxID=735331 RepID=UPI0034E28799
MTSDAKFVNRRDLLKVLGLGGTALAVTGCGNTSIESGAELVQSSVQPEDFVVPGVGVYYASTCTQCSSGCGVMGRVREGRVLKLEGSRSSVINAGKICGLGQAAVQAHYHPDRLTVPMVREGNALKETTWEKAMALLTEKLGPASKLSGEQVAFMTGDVSGHQKALLRNFMDSFESGGRHVVYEALSSTVAAAVHKKMFGVEQPLVHLDKAKMVLSFGNDFMGTGVSPVHFAGQYAKFRKPDRGTLVQIEPKMTLTGANADRWVPIIPGTEGVMALGIARELMHHKEYEHTVPAEIHELIKPYTPEFVSRTTGVPAHMVPHVASLLWEKAPSLVLAGASAEGHAHGSENVAAIMLLNVILDNMGKTLERPGASPFPQLAPVSGSTASLMDFNKVMAAGKCQALLIHDTNPVYSAPDFMRFAENLKKVPFKVALAQQIDETAAECDLVLPLLSSMEDFGTHVASYQPHGVQIGMQQPLMEKLHKDTRSLGDVLLDLLKLRKADAYKSYPDYFAYLKSSVVQAKSAFKDAAADTESFWDAALSAGVLHVEAPASPLSVQVKAAMVKQPDVFLEEASFPFHLVPSVRGNFRDGAHANLPWMQESPDSLTTVVWDSWVELHPKTAEALHIDEGDILEVQSANGLIRAKAYLFPGIHPKVISIPIGQGHENMGRYASHLGVNPLKIINPIFDQQTGELALNATRVMIRKTRTHEKFAKDEGAANTQHGRKLVATIAADKVDLAHEVNNVNH